MAIITQLFEIEYILFCFHYCRTELFAMWYDMNMVTPINYFTYYQLCNLIVFDDRMSKSGTSDRNKTVVVNEFNGNFIVAAYSTCDSFCETIVKAC